MPVMDLGDWIDEQLATPQSAPSRATGRPEVLWYVKRLSANDTQATGGHQAGPYIPRRDLFTLIPQLNRPAEKNPRVEFQMVLDSHPDIRTVTAIWYNNRLRGGTRNETRITGFGGASSSPLLDPNLAGALAVFVFRQIQPMGDVECHVWVCEHGTEADFIEEYIGPVEPGGGRVWPDLFAPLHQQGPCWLQPDQFPPAWLDDFPSGVEMLRRSIELRPGRPLDADRRLERRRACEEQLFYSLENAIEFPRILERFNEFRTFGEVMDHMQPSAQRRRSRSGNSLQLHVRQIFNEEGLEEDRDYSYQPISEGRERPDFLFPNVTAYRDPAFPENNLRMLGVKTTLRDRWRQILREAARIKVKHLLTLDTITEPQLHEMQLAGIELVVPRPLHRQSKPPVRPYLQTLESFIADVRLLSS